jgi:hypothetical protein
MQSPRDENRITAIMGVLNTDGITPKNITCNSITHAISVANGVTGSDFGNKQAVRDENSIPVAMVLSSADGTTLVPIYADITNNLLIKST